MQNCEKCNKIGTDWCDSSGPPHVPNQAPMPQARKQLLNACAVPPIIVIALLAGCQSSILSSNEWHNGMSLAFGSTIMAPNFKIGDKISSGCITPAFLGADSLVWGGGGKNRHEWATVIKKMPGTLLLPLGNGNGRIGLS